MDDNASTSSFCTMGMGGMMMSSSGSSATHQTSTTMRRRNLGEDTAMPVILPDDDMNDHENNHHDTYGMDDMDNTHGNHDHDGMNHDMNQDRSSHAMYNMMNQGTIMYMDGFHSALFPSSQLPPPPCLNLFHPAWTLHTPARFVFAMVCVTLMGILVEACGVWRVKCLRRGRRHRRESKLNRLRRREEQQRQNHQGHQQPEFRRQSDIGDVSSEAAASSPPASATAATSRNPICPAAVRRIWRSAVPRRVRAACARTRSWVPRGDDDARARRWDRAAASLHAARGTLGYLLMLSVMSYAVEFLVCTVLGMVMGRCWLVDREGGDGAVGGAGGGGVPNNGAAGVGGGIGGMGLGDGGNNDGTWGGGDPCCGVDDDDEDDNISLRGGSMHDTRDPLLLPLVGDNVGVTRRSGGGLE